MEPNQTSVTVVVNLIPEGAVVKLPGLISHQTRQLLEIINVAFLTSLICLFGVVSNIINCVIFVKQGLNTTINISLFGLAVSDLCSVLTLEWGGLCLNPLFINSGIPWELDEIQYLSGGVPHLCFGHITCWITTYITAERFLCIARPLQVKQLITPRRTTILVCFLYIINLATSLIPEYSSSYYSWRFSAERNRSVLGMAFRENRESVEGLGFFLSAIMGTASFPAVIILTLILVSKLRQQAKWRKQAGTQKNMPGLASSRDIKTMNMVVLIATIFIICYTPGILTALAAFFVPGFNVSGRYVNIFYVVWSTVAVFESANSSVNIFLYYKMSSKYKDTFRKLFACCKQVSS